MFFMLLFFFAFITIFSLKESGFLLDWNKTQNSHHSHRREDVAGQGEPPVDELLLLIVEGVSIVNVELSLCSVLSDKGQNLKYNNVTCQKG